MMPTNHRHALVRRRHLLALLMAMPAILTALAVVALDAWRFHQPNSPLFVAPTMHALADAIAHDDVQQAYGFIRSGQDPNGVILVQHPTLTDGRQVEVTPLLWAVATQNTRSVSMLFGFGAHVTPATERQAVCLAERLGRDDIARLLEHHGGRRSRAPCPSLHVTTAALLDALAERE